MVELEKHIKEQRLLLDSDTPRDGHEKRFMQKLEYQPDNRIKPRYVIQVAASVAIIIASAFVIISQNRSGGKVAKTEVPENILEADIYYTSQVNARVDQINDFSFDNAEEKRVLLNELKELDIYQQQLINDLNANPDDDRVINALIRHYQIKLEVMDQIIYQLNQYKTETSKNQNNESI